MIVRGFATRRRDAGGERGRESIAKDFFFFYPPVRIYNNNKNARCAYLAFYDARTVHYVGTTRVY